MPVQVNSSEIDPAKLVGYARSLGFNLFFGDTLTNLNTKAFWDRDTGGELKDFLRVTKSEGARLLIINWDELE